MAVQSRISSQQEHPRRIQGLIETWAESVVNRVREFTAKLYEKSNVDLVLDIAKFDAVCTNILIKQLFEREMTVHVSGSLDGQALDFSVSMARTLDISPRRITRPSPFVSGRNAVQAEAFVKAIAKEPNDGPLMSMEYIEADPFFSEMTLKILTSLEHVTGHDQTPIANRWKVINIAVLAVSSATILATAVVVMNRGETAVMAVFAATMVGGLTYLFLYCLGAAMMPVAFYQTQAAARRIMRFVGTDNPVKAQLLVRIRS